MDNFDYAIMFVEEKLGSGAVMEMMDYIEGKIEVEDVSDEEGYKVDIKLSAATEAVKEFGKLVKEVGNEI